MVQSLDFVCLRRDNEVMTNTKTLHDVWFFECFTYVNGERRGFSRQIKARPDMSRTVPLSVEWECEDFLASVVALSDLNVYSSVERGEREDWPYRTADYVLSCNGREVVRSCAISPVKPNVLL